MTSPPHAFAPLPIGRLVRHAYLDVIANWRGLVQVGGLWLLLGWALLLLGRGGLTFFAAVADLVVTLGAAAIAVMWHRHILLGEPLAAWMAPVNIGVVRYFVFTVLLTLIPMLGILLGGGLVSAPVGGAILLVPVILLGALYVALRLQLVLPGIALGDARMNVARSWQLTRGNGWRLFAGFMLITLPVALLAIGLVLGLEYLAEQTGSIFLGAASDLAAIGNAWVQVPLIASFLSYCYAFFTRSLGEAATTT